MQCLRRCLLGFVCACAALAGATALGAYYVGGWLSAADAPEKAGAILVLGGDSSRALEAADLYYAGFAPKIYLSAPMRETRERLLASVGVDMPDDESTMRRVLAARGVPPSAVELLARDMVSTVQEASTAAQRLAGVPGPLLIVTSPYHVRRARIVFRAAMPARELRVIGSRYDPIPKDWWTDQTAARNVVLETAKLLYYFAGGRFSAVSTSTRQS
ncbi:MAG TPA: YdcF family protein [Burkholderiales bacterium]|nr:YdcF family protein [Burkholderiales bacterium]